MYVFDVRADWYEDYLDLDDEIDAAMADDEDDGRRVARRVLLEELSAREWTARRAGCSPRSTAIAPDGSPARLGISLLAARVLCGSRL